MPSFKHAGHLGDLIYALPIVRASGGGPIYLNFRSPQWRNLYGRDPFRTITALLEQQPYVEKVLRWSGQKVDYDLDRFRDRRILGGRNLVEVQAALAGFTSNIWDQPWLIANPVPIQGKEVLIHRCPRWQSPLFRWEVFLDNYDRKTVAFVGMEEEHTLFQKSYGDVDYLPTRDLLDLARKLMGCRLFAGNQSCPYAIAEGLKINAILEVSTRHPNCIFYRDNLRKYMVY